MADEHFPTAISQVAPRQMVTLEGHPTENERSEWHVNKAIDIGTGASLGSTTDNESAPSQTKAIILQKGDASENWIVIVLQNDDGDWTINTFRHFTDSTPDIQGEGGKPIDPSSVSVVEID